MDLIWGIAAVFIYFGIIGLLVWDTIDQIRSRKNEWKVSKRNNRSKNRHIRI